MTRAKKALSQVVLLISGAIMLGFGAMRGEVENPDFCSKMFLDPLLYTEQYPNLQNRR